jgi:hypothetical protein
MCCVLTAYVWRLFSGINFCNVMYIKVLGINFTSMLPILRLKRGTFFFYLKQLQALQHRSWMHQREGRLVQFCL